MSPVNVRMYVGRSGDPGGEDSRLRDVGPSCGVTRVCEEPPLCGLLSPHLRGCAYRDSRAMYGRTWSRTTLIRTFVLVLIFVVLTTVSITIASVRGIMLATIVPLVMVPGGTVVVTLWGFSTDSPVGVVISLTEVVVVVVAKIIEIASIRGIIPSIWVVITTRILVITIIPLGVIVGTLESVSTVIPIRVVVLLTIIVIATPVILTWLSSLRRLSLLRRSSY